MIVPFSNSFKTYFKNGHKVYFSLISSLKRVTKLQKTFIFPNTFETCYKTGGKNYYSPIHLKRIRISLTFFPNTFLT